MSQYIAVDIGGTWMRAASYPEEGLQPIQLARILTQDQKKNEKPQNRLINLIRSVWPKDADVKTISIAAPGLVNPYTGTVLFAPNIPGWTNIPLRDRMEERFDVPVSLGNDANLAALGEWAYGAGQGYHHIIYLTVSTGIGSGIIIDDRLMLGEKGIAAEIGHITVVPDGPLCGCGQRGHLEALASGTAIARWVLDKLAQGAITTLPQDQAITTEIIAEAARQGDKLCIAALERAGRLIGQALANLLLIFNPTAIIIGGGVSQSGTLLFEPMLVAMKELTLSSSYLDNLTLTRAAFGDEVGLVGALALGRSRYPHTKHNHD